MSLQGDPASRAAPGDPPLSPRHLQ